MSFNPAKTKEGFRKLLDFILNTQYDSHRPMVTWRKAICKMS